MAEFAPVSHAEFLVAIHDLAGRIGYDGWRPDHIVGIGRGGLVPGTFLSHATGTPLLSIDLSAGIAEFGTRLVERLAARSTTERLLFVDDINDSGATIAGLRTQLAAAGAMAGQIRFAVLLDNLRSGQQVDYRHRSIDRAEDKRWFVFPWEAVAPTETVAADALAVPQRLA